MPWREEDHPRGQPENAGEFASKEGGPTSSRATVDLFHQSSIADKENYKRWSTGMSKSEKKTVSYYLGDDGYVEINNAAREGRGTPQQENMINDLERVIQRAGSLGAQIDVFRGIKNAEIVEQVGEKVGQRIVLSGFQSTSKHLSTALRFALKKDKPEGYGGMVLGGPIPGKYGALLRIKTDAGMDVGRGEFGGEGEVLLGHGWEYEVESVGEVEVTSKGDDFFPLPKPPPLKYITLRVVKSSPSTRKQNVQPWKFESKGSQTVST